MAGHLLIKGYRIPAVTYESNRLLEISVGVLSNILMEFGGRFGTNESRGSYPHMRELGVRAILEKQLRLGDQLSWFGNRLVGANGNYNAILTVLDDLVWSTLEILWDGGLLPGKEQFVGGQGRSDAAESPNLPTSELNGAQKNKLRAAVRTIGLLKSELARAQRPRTTIVPTDDFETTSVYTNSSRSDTQGEEHGNKPRSKSVLRVPISQIDSRTCVHIETCVIAGDGATPSDRALIDHSKATDAMLVQLRNENTLLKEQLDEAKSELDRMVTSHETHIARATVGSKIPARLELINVRSLQLLSNLQSPPERHAIETQTTAPLEETTVASLDECIATENDFLYPVELDRDNDPNTVKPRARASRAYSTMKSAGRLIDIEMTHDRAYCETCHVEKREELTMVQLEEIELMKAREVEDDIRISQLLMEIVEKDELIAALSNPSQRMRTSFRSPSRSPSLVVSERASRERSTSTYEVASSEGSIASSRTLSERLEEIEILRRSKALLETRFAVDELVIEELHSRIESLTAQTAVKVMRSQSVMRPSIFQNVGIEGSTETDRIPDGPIMRSQSVMGPSMLESAGVDGSTETDSMPKGPVMRSTSVMRQSLFSAPGVEDFTNTDPVPAQTTVYVSDESETDPATRGPLSETVFHETTLDASSPTCITLRMQFLGGVSLNGRAPDPDIHDLMRAERSKTISAMEEVKRVKVCLTELERQVVSLRLQLSRSGVKDKDIDEAMHHSGLKSFLDTNRTGVFERLYKDALDRIARLDRAIEMVRDIRSREYLRKASESRQPSAWNSHFLDLDPENVKPYYRAKTAMVARSSYGGGYFADWRGIRSRSPMREGPRTQSRSYSLCLDQYVIAIPLFREDDGKRKFNDMGT